MKDYMKYNIVVTMVAVLVYDTARGRYLQRIHQHQTSTNTGKKKMQRRRMSSISWEDTDDEEDKAQPTTTQTSKCLSF